MSHSDLLFGVGKIDDPEKRFLQVAKYYLSGWHIKPKGVKKPYVGAARIFCVSEVPD